MKLSGRSVGTVQTTYVSVLTITMLVSGVIMVSFCPPNLAKKKKGSGRVNGVREAGICASVVSRGNSQLSELSQA